MSEEQRIEEFTHWLLGNASIVSCAEISWEAARRFGMKAEDWAVLDELNSMSMSESNLVWPESLRSVVMARRKALEPKPRYRATDGCQVWQGNDTYARRQVCVTTNRTDAELIAAALNQAHETERG